LSYDPAPSKIESVEALRSIRRFIAPTDLAIKGGLYLAEGYWFLMSNRPEVAIDALTFSISCFDKVESLPEDQANELKKARALLLVAKFANLGNIGNPDAASLKSLSSEALQLMAQNPKLAFLALLSLLISTATSNGNPTESIPSLLDASRIIINYPTVPQ
jgi:hypothetical protein